MIQHLVLFRLRDGVARDDPRVRRAEATTQAHPAHIQEIRSWLAGRNVTTRDAAYDFALVGTFADRAGLDRYMVHPHHLLGVKHWREVATWVVADLECADAGIAASPPARHATAPNGEPRAHDL